MLGASQAGLAFSNSSVALVHGMSRPIGAHFHVPHGLSNAMLLPAVTRFSISGAPARYAEAARRIGLAADEDSRMPPAPASSPGWRRSTRRSRCRPPAPTASRRAPGTPRWS